MTSARSSLSLTFQARSATRCIPTSPSSRCLSQRVNFPTSSNIISVLLASPTLIVSGAPLVLAQTRSMVNALAIMARAAVRFCAPAKKSSAKLNRFFGIRRKKPTDSAVYCAAQSSWMLSAQALGSSCCWKQVLLELTTGEPTHRLLTSTRTAEND